MRPLPSLYPALIPEGFFTVAGMFSFATDPGTRLSLFYWASGDATLN